MEEALIESGMGKGDTAWTDSRARGDEILWMGERDDAEYDHGVGEACARMHLVAREVWGVVCPGGELDKTSYQLARYPGEGSKYVRHTDVSDKCPTRS